MGTKFTTIQISEATLQKLQVRKTLLGLQSYDVLITKLLELPDRTGISDLIDERIEAAKRY